MKEADITFQNDEFIISGDLNFLNVMSVYEKSLPQLKKTSELNFNFAELQSSDSSCIALIIEWEKYAKRANKTIRIKSLSQEMLSIIKVSGLNKLICG